MSIRRPDPRHAPADEPRAADPLGDAVWIRPFRSGDEGGVRALVRDVLAEFGLATDPSGTDSDLDDVEGDYRGRGGEFWVVEDGHGRVVGACGVWITPSDPAVCELRKMYLHPDRRGRGVGGALLRTALDHARRAGCRRMELETASSMTAAIALYQSIGFEEQPDAPRASRCDRRFGLDL